MRIRTGVNGDGSAHYEEIGNATSTTKDVDGVKVTTIVATDPNKPIVIGRGANFGINNS